MIAAFMSTEQGLVAQCEWFNFRWATLEVRMAFLVFSYLLQLQYYDKELHVAAGKSCMRIPSSMSSLSRAAYDSSIPLDIW